MEIKAIKTHKIETGESLEYLLDKYILAKENSIIVITSKVISICQNRVVAKNSIPKEELIRKEADLLLETHNTPYGHYLTIKNKILIPSAGIDESNGNGLYILYPINVQETACVIWEYLRKKHGVKNLGILITDSHTTPLRCGVTGISLAWCGFEPLYSYIGKPDIYGRLLQCTNVNILDALAASAVFVMGEGDEQTPIAILNNCPKITFVDRIPTETEKDSVSIPINNDIYAPLLTAVNWVKCS